MPPKTISLELSAYDRLAAAKRPRESFSDVVLRLTSSEQPSLLDLVGILPKDVAEDLHTFHEQDREEARRLVERRGRRVWSGTR